MKKNILFILLLSLISTWAIAQDGAAETAAAPEKDKPVSAPFESGYLIDAQTTVIQPKKTLEMTIQHKFGTIENGHKDLWGIYAPGANIRIGLDYVLLKNFQVGIGISKNKMATDLNAKWTIMEQTRKNTMPVALTLFGNVAIDGRNLSEFESGNVQVAHEYASLNAFAGSDRLSYFSELIVGRKFNKWLSLQAGVSLTHYNAVGLPYDHDKVGYHFSGRIKVTRQGSIVFNYDQPLQIKDISEQNVATNPSKPNLAFGYEVSTGAHSFQIYMASTTAVLPQETMMWNQNDYKNNGFAIGFLITRLWGF